jgi:hypothetical protein
MTHAPYEIITAASTTTKVIIIKSHLREIRNK